ncbi:MAG: hypothetical protein DRJ33_08385 [Candidatus Methanomethylicota archaeon]|uniref:MBL fold metallo-hydrolase n=1 Tax=Thermoproteota archaeon TaxID=2056631 RepID=A0A497EPI6_9CREN|nr:MAG: hypothetical protein DRJ33_08385 [Candidatus Verstraetearchaeota archaeon]
MLTLKILGSGQEFGRACIYLKTGNSRILLDCGINPGEIGRRSLPKFSLIDLSNLSAIVLTHAHLDHSAASPSTLSRGFKGRVYMTLPTMALAHLLWRDEYSIMEREWKGKSKLWSLRDMQRLLADHCVAKTYHEEFSLNGIKLNFHNAGHILGSAMVEVKSPSFRLVYTGDLGTSSNHLRLWKTSDIAYPDFLICEATYGGVDRRSRVDVEKEFVSSVREVLESGGKVLIPAFSVGRAQEVLKVFKDKEKVLSGYPVYVEGMAVDALRIYNQFIIYMDESIRRAYLFSGSEPFELDAISFPKTMRQRKEIISSKNPCVIIAPSGMLRGGWSLWYFSKLASAEENMIALCGHMAEGTLANRLLKGERAFIVKDMISGKKVSLQVKAKVQHFEISAHAMHSELCNFIAQMKPETLILVHGSASSIEALAKSVEQHASNVYMPLNTVSLKFKTRQKLVEEKLFIEVPLTDTTRLMLPRYRKVLVKHLDKQRFLRPIELRSLMLSLKPKPSAS